MKSGVRVVRKKFPTCVARMSENSAGSLSRHAYVIHTVQSISPYMCGGHLAWPVSSYPQWPAPHGQSKPQSRAATYFVDCASEARKGDGRSADSPWTNLEQVNAHVFGSGEEVRFQRGSVCHGTLWPKGSGSESAPIRMTAYGTGKRPKIVAEPKNDAVLKLFNQEYWNIDSVDLSGANTFGVLVSGDQGILHHIHLANLLVHDIGGAEMKHKESGLVVISPGSVDQRFDDVLVDGVTAYNTQAMGWHMVGGGNFGFPPESTWSTHVTHS